MHERPPRDTQTYALSPCTAPIRSKVKQENTPRVAAKAIEAAGQSDRLTVRAIREPGTLDRLLAQWPDDRPLILCDETGAGGTVPGIAAALMAAGQPVRDRAGFVIGPEGGFAQEEL